jgi:DNA-binding transcriptional ArsR family regulator
MANHFSHKKPGNDERCDIVASAVPLLKALGNQHRLNIIFILSKGECSVTDLSKKVGISMSSCSQHLAVLRHEGIVQFRRDGLSAYYSLVPVKAQQVFKLLK